MQTLNLSPIAELGVDIHYVRERLIDGDLQDGSTTSDETKAAARDRLKRVIADMSEYCEIMEAPEVCAFIALYKEEPPEDIDVFDTVTRAFWATIDSKTALFLDRKQRAFLESVAPFGDEVSVKAFPDAANDIEDASRALAFDMPVAVVFHLMRAMEAAVGQMATLIGVTNTDIEWGKLLSAIDDKIKALPAGAERKQWSEARANLWHVKECWRNDTMHPRRSYTQAQAEEIFQAVKVFMTQLSVLVLQKQSP